MPAAVLVEMGRQINYRGAKKDAELDWNYAVEMDQRTCMTLLREVLADV
jgi:hypothetical protein